MYTVSIDFRINVATAPSFVTIFHTKLVAALVYWPKLLTFVESLCMI